MATQAGLWIDHRKAVIVSVADGQEATTQVDADVEKHVRYSGGTASGSHGSQSGGGEDTRERRFEGELAKYYDEVIAHVHNAEAIFVLGPGEAKLELKARLEAKGLGARIVGIETADKMTNPQVAARVRAQFLK